MTRFQTFKRLRQENRGSLPVIVAVMMVPLMGIVGGAVDFGHAVSERTRLNNALDAAALVAARAAQDADASGKSDSDVRTIAEKAGADYFNAMKNLPKDTAGRVQVAINDRVATITASYTASMPTTMLGVLGFKSLPISNNATSAVNLSPLVDIHLLIDVSGSMAIGATDADVTKLRDRVKCAFACHDNNPFTETTGTGANKKTTTYADTFDWAQKNGVNLRINEINKGITDFVNALIKQSASSKRLRISVHSFSNELSQIVALTSTLNSALTALPKTPNASSETEGGTHFSDIMPSFAATVGQPGDGTSKPHKLVIIATDGVQDPNRLWSHSGYEWMRPLVRPFDPADCRKLDPKVTVGVLYAPYINMSWDWGFNDTLGKPSQIGGPGTRFDDIVPQLRACASTPSMFINASTTASIGDAFQALYSTFKTVRLAK